MQVPEIQILEPALCYGDDSLREVYESAYKQLTGVVPLNLVTFYDDLGSSYAWAVQLPVAAISLDFVGVVRYQRFFCFESEPQSDCRGLRPCSDYRNAAL